MTRIFYTVILEVCIVGGDVLMVNRFASAICLACRASRVRAGLRLTNSPGAINRHIRQALTSIRRSKPFRGESCHTACADATPPGPGCMRPYPVLACLAF